MYWNCHDVAVRFAVLAAVTTANCLILQALSVVSEKKKLHQQSVIDSAKVFSVTALKHALEYMETNALYAGAV
jgi:hypothetical protein